MTTRKFLEIVLILILAVGTIFGIGVISELVKQKQTIEQLNKGEK